MSSTTILLVCAACTARAQQPTIAVAAAAQVVTGDDIRLGGQNRVEPDLCVFLSNPGFRFGTLEVAISATRRDEQAVLGRSFVHLDGAKLAGLSWTIDAGDAWRMPALSDFGFANLFAPPVTFEGVSIGGASARTRVSAYGGRVTAQRNIFGTDTVAVGQQIYQAYAEHRVSERLDVYGWGAHVRNGTVQNYPALVDVATDVSGGARYRVTPSIAVAAEAGYAQFRRRGSTDSRARTFGAGRGDLVGASRMAAAQRPLLPIGYFPTINFPYSDREGVFAAGEWDAHRLVRLFAGAEFATTGLDEAAADEASSGVAPGTQTRGYGGVRVRVGDRSLVSVRVEDGGREIRPSSFNDGYESDTGVVSADWHAGFERWNAFARYERRENVEPNNQGSSSPSTTRRCTRISAWAPDDRSSPRRCSPAAPTEAERGRRCGRSAAVCSIHWRAGSCGPKATRAGPATGSPLPRRTGSRCRSGSQDRLPATPTSRWTATSIGLPWRWSRGTRG